MRNKLFRKTFNAIFSVVLLLFCSVVYAENIDPYDDDSQYAYGENVGWINFEPSQGLGVTVTDTEVTGYAWGENIGWINLSPTEGGVVNDGNGNLSGYAWGENVGWISFSCQNTASCGTADYGVTINPTTGEFSGKAWGENIGWITFRSTGAVAYGVTTSLPPAIAIPTDCQSFTYYSVTSPVLSADPSQAKPMGLGTVAEGGGTLSITVKTYQFSGPVDIYFGLYSPEIDPDNIYLLTSGGAFQKLSEGLAPWKANITGPIDESLFGDIQTSTLPQGTYCLYLLVTPAGNLDNCYLWITNFSVD